MAKKTKIGRCALCLKVRSLALSHFMPQGVYRRLRNPAGPVKDPVLVTAKVSMSTSTQVRDFLLCRECEKRFDRLGEDYVLRQMRHRGGFPLLERMRVSPMIDFSLREGIYSGPAIGIDTEKLAYFALSVIWRSTVHSWRFPDGHAVASISLRQFQEPVRRYLLGESEFPPGVAVLVTACTDRESQNVAYDPTPVRGIPNRAVAFLACGIHFTMFLGPTVPASIGEMCCFSSRRRLVFSRDIKHTTFHAYSALAATSKEVGKMSA